MKLILVSEGLQFTVQGRRYSHDLSGRHGGGQMAVVDLDSGEKTMMSGSTEVKLVEDKIIDPPLLTSFKMPLELKIPDPDQLVNTEENVEDVEQNV